MVKDRINFVNGNLSKIPINWNQGKKKKTELQFEKKIK